MQEAVIRALTAGLIAAAVLAGGAGAHARAAATCTPPKYPGVGYFLSLSVKNTSCATGKKLAVAYYRCRLRHGRAGRCTTKVMGYACRETRNSIPTEIDARVTCRSGRKTIIHAYQQDL